MNLEDILNEWSTDCVIGHRLDEASQNVPRDSRTSFYGISFYGIVVSYPVKTLTVWDGLTTPSTVLR